ncbi:MAG: NAD-dependent epimerase/dehydratase family protein [Nitrospira sp.]
MHVLVLGADGYCGWATTLFLSARGYEVTASDNYVRRSFWDRYRLRDYPTAVAGENTPLYPVAPAEDRLKTWKGISGYEVPFVRAELDNFEEVADLIKRTSPDAIVHFAEQRSAPFSNLSPQHALETLRNNTFSTYNLLEAIARINPAIHLVKLGTMGEYGYTPRKDVIIEGDIDFPKRPASPYHMTKCMDSIALEMMGRIYKLCVTDLHQGVVYGIVTAETTMHRDLFNRFDYDGVWGTIVNRFCMQALCSVPLTVYGAGGQSRGFISIEDAIRCIEISLRNPADPGVMVVRNQITEIKTISEVATLVQDAATMLGINVALENTYNPRLENENHALKVSFGRFQTLGLTPHTMRETLIDTELTFLRQFAVCVDKTILLNQGLADWRKTECDTTTVDA